MLITVPLNRRLHKLLNDLHIMDMKDELVNEFTDHRTTHSSKMTSNEALQLIKSLENKTVVRVNELDKQRKKVISIMIEMWAIDEKGKADMDFIYWFSLNYIHKFHFNKLTKSDLSSMISILQKKWLPWFYKQKKTNVDFTIKTLKNGNEIG